MGISNLDAPQDGGVQIVPNQPTGPAKSAVAEASDRARAAIASGQSAAGTPPAPVAPAVAPAPPAGRAPVAPPVAPVAPVPTPAVQPPADETPEAKQAREAAAAAAGAAAQGETPEAIAARETAEALQVELPIGETEDDHLILTANDPETAEQLRKLVDVAIEGRGAIERVEQMEAQVREIEELREYADADTIGFTLDMIGTDIAKAEATVMYLLTQPSLYARVKEKIAKLADPTGFRLEAADAREQRHTMTEQAQDRIETSRVVRQNLQDVQTTVQAMLPENLTPAQRQVAYRDCLRDLKDHADSKELLVLPVHQIPTLLAQRLSALGIDPEEAAARATVAAARKGGSSLSPRMPARVAATQPPPVRPAAAAPKKDGNAFVLSAARKRDAGAIPNAGAGSPTNPGGLSAPKTAEGKPMGIADTLKWHREQRAKGVKLW